MHGVPNDPSKLRKTLAGIRSGSEFIAWRGFEDANVLRTDLGYLGRWRVVNYSEHLETPRPRTNVNISRRFTEAESGGSGAFVSASACRALKLADSLGRIRTMAAF
jgi:hypothetical protein